MLDACAFRFLSFHTEDVVDLRVVSVTDADLVVGQPISSKEEFEQLTVQLQQVYSDYGECPNIHD
jgi:hypothetical protein